ncbi:MAG: tyrosine-type recombinase/integrase, partial [Blastocatellia bacterium]
DWAYAKRALIADYRADEKHDPEYYARHTIAKAQADLQGRITPQKSEVSDMSHNSRKESRVWWIHYRDRNGIRRRESTQTEDWNEAQKRLRERLQARDNNVLDVVKKGESLNFGQWADFFLENYSKPPMRAEKTHKINERAAKHLNSMFASSRLVDVTADHVELYLRDRLRQRVRIKSSLGVRERNLLQPATVHQEFRVLRRMLNVAVRKKLLPANPCAGVEFPVRVKGLFRPHYVSWSEQKRIEQHAQPHLRNIVRIITETGLRVYKELMTVKKEHVDLANAVVWIPDSKTPNGIAEVPLTPLAVEAFRSTDNCGTGTIPFPE